MKTSEILEQAKANIEDENNWAIGWVDDVRYGDARDILLAKKVCAVTSVARVCEVNGVTELAIVDSRTHSCDCEYCEMGGDEYLGVEDAMADFDHEARDLLDEAAHKLYDGNDIITINDDPKYGHADVMKCYALAIEKAKAVEATA